MGDVNDDPVAHRMRHVELHQALDELAADYLTHHPRTRPDGKPKLLSNTTVLELLEWSHTQTVDPTPRGENKHARRIGPADIAGEPVCTCIRDFPYPDCPVHRKAGA